MESNPGLAGKTGQAICSEKGLLKATAVCYVEVELVGPDGQDLRIR